MKTRKTWECTLCGSPTDEKDKVCVVCRTDDTSIRGHVNKEKVEGTQKKKPC